MLSKMPSFQQQKNMIHAKKQESMIGEGKKKKKERETASKRVKVSALVEKIFKITVINMLKE